MKGEKIKATHCSICTHELDESDLETMCIDCAIMSQGAMLMTYKKNMNERNKKT